jgi:hypothetical protein
VSSVSNGLYFLALPLVSVMRVIYTSKGMSKKFGVRVIYRKLQYMFLKLKCGVSSVEDSKIPMRRISADAQNRSQCGSSEGTFT